MNSKFNIGLFILGAFLISAIFLTGVNQAFAPSDTTPPTFTASRTALNTIVLTFSEPVSGTAITNSFTVSGITSPNVVKNTAPTNSNTLTLTTTGLTSPSSTHTVTYVANTGDIKDAASNEIANGATATTTSFTLPTFTASRTALNTIVLTFSESVTGSAIPGSFTVAGASSVTNTAPTNSNTLTLTTTGLTSFTSTHAVTYVAAIGDIKNSANNEIQDNTTNSGTTAIKPTFVLAALTKASGVLDITFSRDIDNTPISDVDLAQLFLSETGKVNQVPLTGATINTVGNSTTISITLSVSQRQLLSTLSGLELDIASGAVKDTSGNTILAASDKPLVTTLDKTPPTFTASRTALNTIVLTFNEFITGTGINNSFTVAGASFVAVNTASTNTLFDADLTDTADTPDGKDITVGSAPHGIAISGTKAYVTNVASNSVSVIDLSTNTLVDADPNDATNSPAGKDIAVGNIPYGIAISGTKAYVANPISNSVSVIDLSTNTLVDANGASAGNDITVGSNPYGIAISGTKAYVTNSGS
ncbi:MAG: hypothetical protein CK527_04895, partial [Nitrosarchaeum sp.]